jgi:hypothetical protein
VPLLCDLLHLKRSSFYYTAAPEPDDGVGADVGEGQADAERHLRTLHADVEGE